MDSLANIKIYSYSSCSSCKKGIKWLNENKLEYELIDILKNPPSLELINKALTYYKNNIELLNTRGVSYRKIGALKLKSMEDNEVIEEIMKDPKLIKRPFLVNKSIILIGFNAEKWTSELIKLI